jgi:hypothetical protein
VATEFAVAVTVVGAVVVLVVVVLVVAETGGDGGVVFAGIAGGVLSAALIAAGLGLPVEGIDGVFMWLRDAL